MRSVKDITVCCIDHGLFLSVAQALAKTCKRVLYQTPTEKAFTTLNDHIIGDGYPDIERCEDFWPIKDEIDLFVFSDIQHSGLQLELESQGFSVWGGRKGDSLELSREKFHRVLADVGLQVPKFERIVGLTKLREYLKDAEDRYIKISKYRGSLETFHWRNWGVDETALDVLAVRFGPAKELIPFLVFEPIHSEMEMGGDTFVVDGQWPDKMLHGTECKDKAYFSAVTEREKMPQQLQDVMEAFGPVLKPYRARQQWSMEVRRVSEDEAYFIDPTLRGGLPSTGSQLELISNLADVIWHGAHGDLLQPEYKAKFSAEVILTAKADKSAWTVVEVPTALKDAMKLANCCEIDGRICFPPNDDGDPIGWLVATGNSPQETLNNILELAKELPDGVSAATEDLADVFKEIHAEQGEDIQFTQQKVPEPEAVLEK